MNIPVTMPFTEPLHEVDHMRTPSFSLLLWLGILLSSSLFLAGCANSTDRPVAVAPPLYNQMKIQAFDHWDTVADRVAERILLTYQKRNDLIARPIYIQRPNDKPFSLAFESLLRTRLVTRGMQVAHQRTTDAVLMEFDVQVILHDKRFEVAIPGLAELGIAVAGLFTGNYVRQSDHEVLINTRLVDNNRYVMHLSTPCYIDDDEWAMYANPRIFDSRGGSSRTIRMTNR